mgnify:CR=1 FL=1
MQWTSEFQLKEVFRAIEAAAVDRSVLLIIDEADRILEVPDPGC